MNKKVLQFKLENENFCIDINKIEEIVESEKLTNIPNTNKYVEGVMDLRGNVTKIINPKYLLNIDNKNNLGDFVIVFENNKESIGWIVDEVKSIIDISDENINKHMATNQDNVNGVISIDDEFFVLVNPIAT